MRRSFDFASSARDSSSTSGHAVGSASASNWRSGLPRASASNARNAGSYSRSTPAGGIVSAGASSGSTSIIPAPFSEFAAAVLAVHDQTVVQVRPRAHALPFGGERVGRSFGLLQGKDRLARADADIDAAEVALVDEALLLRGE